jgi:transposase-like protein
MQASNLWFALTEQLGYEKNSAGEKPTENRRDGTSSKVDGLTGFPDALNAVFPDTEAQLCMVHMVRNSVKYISFKDRKAIGNWGEALNQFSLIYGARVPL